MENLQIIHLPSKKNETVTREKNLQDIIENLDINQYKVFYKAVFFISLKLLITNWKSKFSGSKEIQLENIFSELKVDLAKNKFINIAQLISQKTISILEIILDSQKIQSLKEEIKKVDSNNYLESELTKIRKEIIDLHPDTSDQNFDIQTYEQKLIKLKELRSSKRKAQKQIGFNPITINKTQEELLNEIFNNNILNNNKISFNLDFEILEKEDQVYSFIYSAIKKEIINFIKINQNKKRLNDFFKEIESSLESRFLEEETIKNNELNLKNKESSEKSLILREQLVLLESQIKEYNLNIGGVYNDFIFDRNDLFSFKKDLKASTSSDLRQNIAYINKGIQYVTENFQKLSKIKPQNQEFYSKKLELFNNQIKNYQSQIWDLDLFIENIKSLEDENQRIKIRNKKSIKKSIPLKNIHLLHRKEFEKYINLFEDTKTIVLKMCESVVFEYRQLVDDLKEQKESIRNSLNKYKIIPVDSTDRIEKNIQKKVSNIQQLITETIPDILNPQKTKSKYFIFLNNLKWENFNQIYLEIVNYLNKK